MQDESGLSSNGVCGGGADGPGQGGVGVASERDAAGE